MMNQIPAAINNLLRRSMENLETLLQSDVIAIHGAIEESLLDITLYYIEELKKKSTETKGKLSVILTTYGGSAEVAERLVNIFRNHYTEVDFYVPDYAYSAGTILCMSGDNIFMDYYSVLGPIDPQVRNKEGVFVPALGYLDKINDLIQLAREGEISQAEFLILKDFDLAELKAYEQARDLTVDLLKSWLVKYKLKNWNVSETQKKEITKKEKEQRAEEIAKELGNHNRWLSHGRPLNIERLDEIGLKIEDFGKCPEIKEELRYFHKLMVENMRACHIGAQVLIKEVLS